MIEIDKREIDRKPVFWKKRKVSQIRHSKTKRKLTQKTADTKDRKIMFKAKIMKHILIQKECY